MGWYLDAVLLSVGIAIIAYYLGFEKIPIKAVVFIILCIFGLGYVIDYGLKRYNQ